MYLLDTNVCLEILNNRPAKVRLRFDEIVTAKAGVSVSTITAFELSHGAKKSDRKDFNQRRLESFFSGTLELLAYDKDDGIRATLIRAELDKKGTATGPFDTLIAGAGHAKGTYYGDGKCARVFASEGLSLENWSR